jgi:hypothetical protein
VALALLAALAVAVPLDAQRGARVKQQNLAELVGDADVIIAGRVTSVQGEPHPQYTNLYTIVVTLDVQDVWKGRTGTQYTFRQYVWDVSDRRSGLGYKTGQEVVLMLIRPHAQTGLSSPAGLEQGRFRVMHDAQGNALLVNGNDNRRLFDNIDQTAPKLDSVLAPSLRQAVTSHRSGPIPYDQLKQIVQALVANPS